MVTQKNFAILALLMDERFLGRTHAPRPAPNMPQTLLYAGR